jgi:hypothetical protein
MWEIARSTFAIGTPGSVLFQLMFIGVVGFLLSYIASAVGKGQISRMIDVGSLFAAVIMVVSVIVRAIVAVAGVAGFK